MRVRIRVWFCVYSGHYSGPGMSDPECPLFYRLTLSLWSGDTLLFIKTKRPFGRNRKRGSSSNRTVTTTSTTSISVLVSDLVLPLPKLFPEASRDTKPDSFGTDTELLDE